ncbi:hypothetical protein HZC31_04690 [Candidatus Woesearchaeota archaeon]|nr:hypothetical protein [Candidatus Woesearchaeota archaeon]
MTKIVHEYDQDRYRACLTEAVAQAGRGSLTVEGLDAILARYTTNGAQPALDVAVQARSVEQKGTSQERLDQIRDTMTQVYLGKRGRPGEGTAQNKEEAEFAASYFLDLLIGKYVDSETKETRIKEDYTTEQRLTQALSATTDYMTGGMDLFRKKQDYCSTEKMREMYNAAVQVLEKVVFTNMYAVGKAFLVFGTDGYLRIITKEERVDKILNSGKSLITEEELEYVNRIGKPALVVWAKKKDLYDKR